MKLRAEVADFKRDMADAAKAVDRNSAAVDTLSNQVGLIGGVLTGFAAVAVQRFAEFDKAMSAVRASTGATGEELESLRAAALKAGADTAYSAAEAAGAIDALSKAGVSSADILGGGLAGALSLAAAGGLEVADAAEIAASTLTQFNLSGRDVGHVADLLASGAASAQGSVGDLGEALNQAGLIASQSGLSVEETTASLAAFASAGLLGSDAGTSFKTMLQVLAAPSSVARGELDKLGIAAYDTTGQFVGMENLAGQLRTALEDKTEAERNAALATIFGSDAVRAANVIYAEGADGIAEWTDKVDKAGTAAMMAAVQQDNLIGDFEKLMGSIDSVLIQSGSGANEGLRGIVQGAEDVVDALGRIPEPALAITTLIAGGGGLALLGVAGLGKLSVATRDALDAMDQLGLNTDKARGRVGQFAKGAGVAAGALGAMAAGAALMSNASGDAGQGIEEIYAGLEQLAEGASASETVFKNVSGAWGTMQTEGLPLKDLIQGLADPTMWDSINGSVTELSTGFGAMFGADWRTGWQEQRDALNAYSEQLGTLAQSNLPTAVDAFKQLHEETGGTEESGRQLLEVMPEVKDALIGVAREAGLATDDTTLLKIATGELTPEIEEVGEAAEVAAESMEQQAQAIEDMWTAAVEAANRLLGLRDAERGFEAAVDDAREAVKENGRTLDINTEKGRANQQALDAIADSGWRMVESAREQGASQEELRGKMREAREAFIQAAVQMGVSREKARELANQLGLIPKNINSTVTVEAGGALSAVDQVRRALAGVNSKTVSLFVNTVRNEGRNHGGYAVGGRLPSLPGFPTGGRLPGTPPSDPMRDNLLGVDERGVPRVRVRSREWVVNQRASDYYGDGIMSALNSRAIPREALEGLPGLAGGGAIGQAEGRLRAAQSRARAARRALTAAERAERQARSESAQRAAEKRVERAEALLDRRQDAVSEAWDRLSTLRESASELRTDLRRGNVRDSVTGGLSGALGVTDDLRDLAGEVGGWRGRSLGRTAGRGENALRRLYKDAEYLDKRLERATSHLEKWQQIADGVSNSIRGGFSLGDVSGGVNPWSGQERQATGQQLLAAAEQYKSKARALVLKLRELQAAGYGTGILQEVAAQGVDGGIAMADALLQLSPADVKAIQAAQAGIAYYAGRAGVVATGDRLTDAQRAVKQAEAQAAVIDKNIDKWGRRLGAAMAKALGIKARAAGGPVQAGQPYLVGELGPEMVVPRNSGYVMTAARTANLNSPQKVVNVTVVQHYPQQIPYSTAVNKALQHAAEGIV